MALASPNFDITEILDSWPEIPYNAEKAESYALIDSVLKDDKSEFVSHAKRLFAGEDIESERSEALKILNACCGYDSLNCASSLINGDVGPVPYINDIDADTGLSPLHTAAEAHAPRCVEMLLKRRARTDVRSKDGRALLPLELSLCNASSLDVTWNPSADSIGDLILLLGGKDLTVVKLLAEKTKEVDIVAHAYARLGALVPLATLLIVATDKIRLAIVSGSKAKKRTIYESVIQEALLSYSSTQSVCSQKRILLLREIELLQHFGAAVFSDLLDKQTSPLIPIVQVGDEAVLELLINTNINVNGKDAEGNTVLQCSLKGLSVSHKQQTRVMNLLIAHGARVTQRNKLGLSAVHFAAANGNISALEILLAANPELVHAKTVIKETPLFFAVKNNHLDCVELLLQCGACTEIHNLRKQRPIELTQSQDIRFLLNPTNISCFSKETELAQLHSADPTKADDEETSFLSNSKPPPWLKKFAKWLPQYLRDTSNNWGESGYPLSSLKADFRSVFGMDLDHASLGFPKLSDFIKSFPKLCQMKAVLVGKSGPATHLVILPSSSCSQLKGGRPEPIIIKNSDSLSPNKPKPSSTPDLKFIQQAHVMEASSIPEIKFIQQAQVSKASSTQDLKFIQAANASNTLKPEPEGEPPLVPFYSNHYQLKHPVLETLASIKNSTSVFFLQLRDKFKGRDVFPVQQKHASLGKLPMSTQTLVHLL